MNEQGVPDAVDLVLLEALQDEIPLVSRPWQDLADRLGLTEDEVIGRLRSLSEAAIIRGISPVLESRPLGLHAATLVALRVPEERIDAVAGIVSGFLEVSHNFRREGEYPLWFTITAKDRAATEDILARVLAATGIPAPDALDLPTVRRVKIDVRFRFGPPTRGGA
jgi:DNA-binding Lrp family transcriptional regulator